MKWSLDTLAYSHVCNLMLKNERKNLSSVASFQKSCRESCFLCAYLVVSILIVHTNYTVFALFVTVVIKTEECCSCIVFPINNLSEQTTRIIE